MSFTAFNNGPGAYRDALIVKIVAVSTLDGSEIEIAELIVPGLARAGDAEGGDVLSFAQADLPLPSALVAGSYDVAVYFDEPVGNAITENDQLLQENALVVENDETPPDSGTTGEDITVETFERLIEFDGSGFDATRTFSPTVIDVQGDDGSVVQHVLYGGLPFSNSVSVGLATATDNTLFSKSSDAPVIDHPASTDFTSFRVFPERLFFDDTTDEWTLYFWGNNRNLVSDAGHVRGVGVATTTDFVSWSFDPDAVLIEEGIYQGIVLDEIVRIGDEHVAYVLNAEGQGVTPIPSISRSNDGVTFSEVVALPWNDSTRLVSATEYNDGVIAVFKTADPSKFATGYSTDGVTFSQGGTITAKPMTIDELVVRGGEVEIWGTVNVGNVNWGFGNQVVERFSVPLATFAVAEADDGTAQNTAPVASADFVNTDEDTPVTGNLISGLGGATADTDADGDALQLIGVQDRLGNTIPTAQITDLRDGGQLTIAADGSFLFDPDGDFETLENGSSTSVSFEYIITDGTDVTAAVATVSIAAVNDSPIFQPVQQFLLPENDVSIGSVQAVDVDGDSLEYTIIGGTDASLFDLDATLGTLSFIVAPNFESPGDADGNNVYEIQIAASDSVISSLASVSVEVTDVEEGDGIFVGGPGDDTLTGREGNDTLIAYAGDDTLLGGKGADIIRSGSGNDTVDGGAGNDTIFGGIGADIIDGGEDDDLIEGNADDDTIFGGAGNDTLRGAAGIDTIEGGSGADVARGGDDDDYLSGGAGDDTLDGNRGEDTIDGGLGNDELIGGSGADVLYGREGDDAIRGGGGDDTLYGGEGNDRLFGSANNDTVYGGMGDDILEGNAQADELFGNQGNDILRGGDGFDILWGDNDNDILIGGNGNDTLIGGQGVDILRGNAQNDTFRFEFASHSNFNGADLIDGIDGIGAAGGDIIDLSGINADLTSAEISEFTFLGLQTRDEGLNFGAGALWLENNGAQTRIYGNIDNDEFIELAIRINDGDAISASDYFENDFVL